MSTNNFEHLNSAITHIVASVVQQVTSLLEAECSSAHCSPLNTPTLRGEDTGSPSLHPPVVSRRTSAIGCARNRPDALEASAGRHLQVPSTIAAGASTSSNVPTESIAQSSSRVLSLVCIVDEKCLLFCVLRTNSDNPLHAIYCFQPRKTFNIDLDHLQHLLNLKLSMTKIAEILCISRPTLYKIVRDYQLVPKQYR